MLIVSFRHKGLRRLYEEDDVRGLSFVTVRRIRQILTALEFATDLAHLVSRPGWKLHPLRGQRRGEYAISVTGNWRITFRVSGDHIVDVNFEDYH